ncbi:MAG TPA: YceI family protein [Pyrinomonadaceae bacterium]|jgi:polyisoprenoid-binding protein YceI|nr:YceI family protein [Pyrinomonadaceae bacterium]
MKYTRLFALVLCALLVPASIIFGSRAGDPNRARPVGAERRAQSSVRYTLDAGKSSFMARAFSGGPLWFKGHDHFIAIRDFTGDVQLTPGAITPASLQIRVRADSLVETRDVFTEQQKQIINRELREIVLETERYPEIVFKSAEVIVKPTGGGQFRADVGGDLTLHGVTRHVTIPVEAALSGESLRARGEFTILRSDYNVRATSAFHGMVRVRDKIKFTFDILAHPSPASETR